MAAAERGPARKVLWLAGLVVLGCEIQSVEASGLVNDDLLPDFGAIACFKRIAYYAALRLLFDYLRARLAVRTLVQHSHDCVLLWCEAEPLTVEADDLVVLRVI